VCVCVLSLPVLVCVLVLVYMFACLWFPFAVRGVWFGDGGVRGVCFGVCDAVELCVFCV